MEHGGGPEWAGILEDSTFGLAIRQSVFLYPLANVSHVLGIALIVGSIVALDLRLLGLGRDLRAEAVSRLMTTVAVAGFLIAVPSGATMFAADASALAGSQTFQIKLGLVGLGLVNALAFGALWRGRLPTWDADPPPFGRVQVVASLFIWAGAVAGGRLIAYF